MHRILLASCVLTVFTAVGHVMTLDTTWMGTRTALADLDNPLDNHLPAGEVTDAEAIKTYASMKDTLIQNYAKSLLKIAGEFGSWRQFNNSPYVSEHHGDRLVNDYANEKAANYGDFENGDVLPVGAIIAMDSFKIMPSCLPLSITAGAVEPGPLFVMEKMSPGFNGDSGDWQFSMISPDGALIGQTLGTGHENVQFCVSCHHNASQEQDWLFFLPQKYRNQDQRLALEKR
jgi:hypothetical protein